MQYLQQSKYMNRLSKIFKGKRLLRMMPCVMVPTVWWRVSMSQAEAQQDHSESQNTLFAQKTLSSAEQPLKNEQKTQQNAAEGKQQQKILQNETNQQKNQSQNDQEQKIQQNIDLFQVKQQKNAQKELKSQQRQQQSIKQSKIVQQKADLQNCEYKTAKISQKCPQFVVKYLQTLGYTVSLQSTLACVLTLKNIKGDTFTLDSIDQQTDALKLISNYSDPPRMIQTVEQAKKLLSFQEDTDYLIMTYIPAQQEYQKNTHFKENSQYNSFSTSRKVDLKQQMRLFSNLAYGSCSINNSFYVVRAQAAQFFKMGKLDIGVPLILSRCNHQGQNESNRLLDGNRYHVTSLKKQWITNTGNNLNKNYIDYKTHRYLNRIDSAVQLQNLVRQMKMSQDQRKLLVVYCEERQQFQLKMDSILLNLAKVQRNKVIVAKVANKNLLRDLRIETDKVATIRLLNLHQKQKPLFQQKHKKQQKLQNQCIENPFYSRAKFRGPFKLQSLCQFVNGQWIQHIQSKIGLNTVKPLQPNQMADLNNTLVLLQKEGCQGCHYMKETFDELKKIVKGLKVSTSLRNALKRRYVIQDTQLLDNLRLRRYNVFNQSLDFNPPRYTPQAYLFHKGKNKNINLQESLKKLNQIANKQEAQIHDMVLADIIARLRAAQMQTF